MSLLKPILVVLVGSVAPAPVFAADILLTGPHSTQLRIECDDVTCHVRERRLDGHWRMVEATACGQRNFDILEFKYRAAGYR